VSATTPAPSLARLRDETCAQEPIHTPGTIQPHGALFGFDRETRRLLVVSENAADFIRMPVPELLGRTADEILDADTLGSLRAAAAGANPARIRFHGRDLDAIVHRDGPVTFIELEPGAEGDELASAAAVYGAANRIAVGGERADLLPIVAREFRDVTGFDRVMVYHFHPDGHGEVVAEDRADDMEPYLGLHFPASDIPAQARRLYLTKLSRAIVSTSASPVALLTLPELVTHDLDLGVAELRSVSPFHLQFMRNMGQASTVSFSLIHRGELIGMITCAHRTERRLPFLLRRSLEVLGNQVALQLGAIRDVGDLAVEVRRRELRAELLSRMVGSDDLAATLLGGAPSTLDLVAADAAAIQLDGDLRRTHDAPEPALLDELSRRGAYESSSLAADDPELARLLPGFAGVLVVPIGSDGDYVAFFRREVLQSVRWLGDLAESNRATPLSPRVSFSAWTESVTGTSLPWEDAAKAASEFAMGLESALARRHEARLAKLALRDPLTGLPNRRFLQEELERILVRGSDISLLFIDLDDFKRINDSHGHDAGDTVLLEVAQRLIAQVRSQDRVARLGGDEFVIVCENMTAAAAERVASRVIDSLGRPIALKQGDTVVTASCGIVSGWTGTTSGELIERADAAMYRAKASGRNRVSR
jgi:two-component system, chemotaxis family, sensor kinase Cph1